MDVMTMTDEEVIDKHKKLARRVIRDKFGGALTAIKTETSLDYDDLVQVGFIGLLKAKETYDPNLGFKFTTYAARKIVGTVKQAIRDTNKVHISRPVYELITRLKQDDLFDLTAEEISERFEVSLKAAKLAKQYQGYVSLNAKSPRSDDGGESEIMDTFAVESDFSDSVGRTEILQEFFSTLSAKERQLWYLYHVEKLEQKQIGEKVCLSQSHICKLLKRIERKAWEFGKQQGLHQ